MIFTVQVPSSASGISTKELVTALTSPNIVQVNSVEMHFRGVYVLIFSISCISIIIQ